MNELSIGAYQWPLELPECGEIELSALGVVLSTDEGYIVELGPILLYQKPTNQVAVSFSLFEVFSRFSPF